MRYFFSNFLFNVKTSFQMSKFKYPLRYIFPISRAHPSIYLGLTPLYEGDPIFNLGSTSFSLQFRGIHSRTRNGNSKAEQSKP